MPRLFGKKDEDPEHLNEFIESAEVEDSYIDFFSIAADENPAYVIRLYRVNHKDVKNPHTLLDIWHGKICTEMEIGCEYGSGFYKLVGTIPGRKKRDIRVLPLNDPIWDKRKQESDSVSMGMHAYNPYQQMDPLGSSFELLEKVIGLAQKLNNTTQQPGDLKMLGPAFNQLRNFQTDIIKQGLDERMELFNDAKKHYGLEVAKKEAESKNPLWDHPLVKHWVQNLSEGAEDWLSAKGFLKKEVIEGIKEDKKYQELVEDPDKILAVWNSVVKEGDEKKIKSMMEIFDRLGIKILTEDEQPPNEENIK